MDKARRRYLPVNCTYVPRASARQCYLGVMAHARKAARKKAGTERKLRTAAERRETRRILFAGKVGRPSKYRPDFHPDDIIAYFQAAFDAVEEPERVESRRGGVRYVQRPVIFPTLRAYAAKVGVRRETLWAWTRRHEEFAAAVGICKASQEHVLINMSLLGAYVPSFALFLLRNLRRWKDQGKQGPEGGIVLIFDTEDAEGIGEPLPNAEKGVPTAAERREARRIPVARRVGRPSDYRPDFHSADIAAYFRPAFDALEEPERVESRRGGVRYVQRPVTFPTLAGYAAKIGVSQETLWEWTRRHEEFADAVGICKAIQEHVLINMGLLRGYVSSVTIFLLTNLLGLNDEVPERAVVLRFDAQDAAA